MQLAYTINDIMAYLQAMYIDPVTHLPARLLVTPYAYPVVFTTIAQGVTQQTQMQIAANSDFLVMGLQARAQIGAAQTVSTITAPFLRLLIVDSGSNEQYTFQPIDLVNYATINNVVKTLPWPRLVNGRTTLALTLSNYAPTAETYTSVEISFEGVLVRAMDQ